MDQIGRPKSRNIGNIDVFFGTVQCSLELFEPGLFKKDDYIGNSNETSKFLTKKEILFF
jgi:hypothetical protein